jgi:hypothetical protein
MSLGLKQRFQELMYQKQNDFLKPLVRVVVSQRAFESPKYLRGNVW